MSMMNSPVTHPTAAAPQTFGRHLILGIRMQTVPLWLRLVPYGILLWNAYSFFAETVDDPFITFRYAANLIHGHGPVFNIGEHVEGYSSPLHLLLSAFLLVVLPSVGILFKAKAVGLMSALAALTLLRTLAKQSGLGERGAFAAQMLVALNINEAIGAINGLETSLYALILLLTVRSFCQECQNGSGSGSALWCFVALVTRPDALLIVAALAMFRLAWGVRQHNTALFLWPWIFCLAVPSSLFLAFRLSYYGLPLPNTYYAKQVAWRSGIYLGIKYLERPLCLDIPSLHLLRRHPIDLLRLLFIFAFHSLALCGLARARRSLTGKVSILLIGVTLLFVLKTGGDWMPGWRFMVPALPFFALLQVHGFAAVRQATQRRHYGAAWSAAASAGFLVLCVTACVISPHYSWGGVNFSTQDRDLIRPAADRPAWISAGDYLHASFAPGSYIAFSEMGYATYVNLDQRFLDTRGLTDGQVSHFPNALKSATGVCDPHWTERDSPLHCLLVEKQPDAILTFDQDRATMPNHGDIGLAGYQYRGNVPFTNAREKVLMQGKDKGIQVYSRH